MCILAMMCYFYNFTLGCWLYLALHGTYGIFWITKDCLFPDAAWQTKVPPNPPNPPNPHIPIPLFPLPNAPSPSNSAGFLIGSLPDHLLLASPRLRILPALQPPNFPRSTVALPRAHLPHPPRLRVRNCVDDGQ